MAKKYLLPGNGNFYKANLHCHTTVSDGRLTPEQCRDLYRDHGYSILAVTDHNRYRWHRELSRDGFLMLAACEMDINQEFREGEYSRAKTYHLNLYDTCPQTDGRYKEDAVQPHVRYEDKEGINSYLEQMNRLGFLVCYNHPYWSLQNYDDYKDLEGLFALEVYNHSCELDGMYGYQPQVYDELLRMGRRIGCLASDDNHNLYDEGHPMWDSFGGFTMVKAPALDYGHVIEALKKGDFYCSSGPLIHELYLEEGRLHISCSPVKNIYMMTEGRKCCGVLAAEGEFLTSAEFPVSGKEGYFRIDIKDERGRHALSNAWWEDCREK